MHFHAQINIEELNDITEDGKESGTEVLSWQGLSEAIILEVCSLVKHLQNLEKSMIKKQVNISEFLHLV
jgi:hypothetical protein